MRVAAGQEKACLAMIINTISAYETSAELFFDHLEQWGVDLVLDVRLKNTNQLSGFTKRDDLAFFVQRIAQAQYAHDVLFAPAATKLERYLHGNLDWEDFAAAYEALMNEREAIPYFFEHYGSYQSVALVGTATRTRRSHAEVLKAMIEEGCVTCT